MKKFFKGLGITFLCAALGMTAVAGGLYFFKYPTFKKGYDWLKNKISSKNPAIVQEVNFETTNDYEVLPIENSREATATPTVKPTQKPRVEDTKIIPTVTAEPESKISYNDSAYVGKRNANLKTNNRYKEDINSRQYGYTYDQIIDGFTFCSNVECINLSNMSKSEIDEKIRQARCFLGYCVSINDFSFCPVMNATNDTVCNALRGNIESANEYMISSIYYQMPLIDVMAVGETVLNGKAPSGYDIYWGDTLTSFEKGYTNVLEQYSNVISSGLYQEAKEEEPKVLILK